MCIEKFLKVPKFFVLPWNKFQRSKPGGKKKSLLLLFKNKYYTKAKPMKGILNHKNNERIRIKQ